VAGVLAVRENSCTHDFGIKLVEGGRILMDDVGGFKCLRFASGGFSVISRGNGGTTQKHQNDHGCTERESEDPKNEHKPEIALVTHSSPCGNKQAEEQGEIQN
jgi:hypothetical protein